MYANIELLVSHSNTLNRLSVCKQIMYKLYVYKSYTYK